MAAAHDAPRLHRARRDREAGVARRLDAGHGRVRRPLRGAARRRLDAAAPYAVAMAYRVRFYMEMNAREAMHVIELRTRAAGPPGLPPRLPADAPADRGPRRPPRRSPRRCSSRITRRWNWSGSKRRTGSSRRSGPAPVPARGLVTVYSAVTSRALQNRPNSSRNVSVSTTSCGRRTARRRGDRSRAGSRAR